MGEENRISIELEGLTRYYGTTRGVENLNLQVRAGEVVGFLGSNGAGKTTTIRLMLGLLRPTRGNIRLLNQEVPESYPELRRKIGYLPGDLGLYPDLSGQDYLHHMLRLRNGRHSDSTKQNRLIEMFGIPLDRPIRTYSKGMRQIVGIIQAFAHNPSLVILDEPTSGLDPINQTRFQELISQEREAGTTVFFSSHVLSEVQRLCDRVAMIRDGQLVHLQDVHEQRASVGKRIRLLSPDNPESVMNALKGVDGIRNLTVHRSQVEFRYTGRIGDLLQRIARMPIDDLVCEDPEIEEVFYDLYREETHWTAN